MTEQELFNKVCTHLAQQKKRALDVAKNCRYRTKDGLKCAIGCLIADDRYMPELEHFSIRQLRDAGIVGTKDIDITFLASLQSAHDHNAILWYLKEELKAIAEDYHLNAKSIDLITDWS